MAVGRKPKPTHLKLLAGHPGHRPLNDNEPQPDAVDENTQPPSWLKPEGRAVWVREFPKMIRNSMITEVDMNAFARYCGAQGRYENAEKMIEKQGEVMIAPSGFPIQNPYMAISNRAYEFASKAEVEFGMTPSSRSRVSSTGKPKKANRFLDLVDGKKTKQRA